MDVENKSRKDLKAHLICAAHQWCTDMGYTPYMVVVVDETVRVPDGYVQNHTIVLNTSYDSTNRLEFSEHFIEFQARFNGVVHMVGFPYNRVLKVYAKETQEGYDAIDGDLVDLINALEQGTHTYESEPHSEQVSLQMVESEQSKSKGDEIADGDEKAKTARKKTTLKRIK